MNLDEIDIFNTGGPVESDVLKKELMEIGMDAYAPPPSGSTTPAQLVNFLGAFVDPLGAFDALGLYPALPDAEESVLENILSAKRNPSLLENIEQGEKLSTALQAAGVIPLLGGVVRAARGPVKGIRSLDPMDDFDPRFDTRVKEQDVLRGTTAEITTHDPVLFDGANQPRPELRLSDLEGEEAVFSMSDRAAAGSSVLSINEVNLYRPVDLRGGQDYMFENPDHVWASAKVPSQQILDLARSLKDKSGRDPLFIPWRMAPTGGDFSTTVGELMLGYASANMSKTTKKRLDSAIRNFKTVGEMRKGKRVNAGLKVPEWPGVDDPRSVDVWRSLPDAQRKELANMMDVRFRDKKGLSIGAARLVMSDESQRAGMDLGIKNVGRIFADEDLVSSTHPSYPYAIRGGGVGVLEGVDDVTVFELMPDAEIGSAKKVLSDPSLKTATDTEKRRLMRSLQMKPYSGTITEEVLRRLVDRGVAISSVAGLGLGALMFTLTSSGVVTPKEASEGALMEVAQDISEMPYSGVET